jgi:alpha-1,2-mannosyltransferase
VAAPPGSATLAALLDSRAARRLLWAVAAVLWTLMVVIQIRRANPLGWLDLRVYRDSVHQFFDGRPLYDIHVTEVRLPFTYPPVAIYLLAPLAWLPFPVAAGGLLVANGLLLLATCWACLRTLSGGRPVLGAAAALAGAALFLEPVWSTLNFGQVDLLLMAAVTLDVLVVPARFRGILTGLLAAVKLTPLVFLLLFVLRRDWGAMRRLVGTFGVLTAVAFVVLPHESTFYWLHALRDPRRIGPPAYVGNLSTYGALLRMLGDSGMAHVLWLLVSAAVLVVTAVVVRRSVALGHRVGPLALVALAGLLCSPISWDHHWVWMVVLALAATELWAWSRPAAWLAMVLVLATGLLQPKRIELGQKAGTWPGYQRLLVSNVWILLAYALLAVLLVATVRIRPEVGMAVEPATDPGRQRV